MNNSSFDNISREIWREYHKDTPSEIPEPDTGPYIDEFYGQKFDEGINFVKLATFLKSYNNDNRLILQWKDYVHTGNPILSTVKEAGGGYETRYHPENLNIPYTYVNEYKQKITTSFQGIINKRIDYLEKMWAYSVEIKTEEHKILAELDFYFENTSNYRIMAKDTQTPNDFRMERKYVAVRLSTSDLTDFIYLLKDLFGESYSKGVEQRIAGIFLQKLKTTGQAADLKFLYESIPDFVFKHLGSSIDYELFEKHLHILKSYDDTGIWSIFKDSSGAVINLFKMFNNSEFLYYFLVDHPVLIKELYQNMDGSSQINGVEYTNKRLFADLLSALCICYNFSELKNSGASFQIDKHHKLDSNVLFGDAQPDKIFLKQRTGKDIQVSFFTDRGSYTETVGIDFSDEGKGAYFHPLDPVKLIFSDGKNTASYRVPAIYAKAESDEAEWSDIMHNLRIGLDILAIVAGIATLGSASGVIYLLMAADIGLASADLVVAVLEDALMQTPDGQKFLDIWNQVYLVGGIATAGPLLIMGVSTLGARLLSKVTVENTRNFLTSCLLKIVLESNISNFSKNTIKILKPKDIFLSFDYQKLAEKLAENGVFFLSGQKQGKNVETFAAVYKDEVIEEFSKAEIHEFYKKWKKIKNEKIATTLEEIAGTIKYENGRMDYVEGLNDGIEVSYKPRGFENLKDIEDFDPKYGRGIVTKFEGYEGYFYRNFDAKNKTFTFNHGFLQDLPKWVEDVKVPLVQGKGIPTQVYFTLRQIKLLNIAEGEIQMVRMSQIQNLDTAAFIHQATGGKIIRNFDSVDILAAPSNEYMKTVMTQAGYEATSGRITGKGIYMSVKQLKTRNFPLNPKFEGSYEAFMKEYQLSWDSKLYIDYNIEVRVKYIK